MPPDPAVVVGGAAVVSDEDVGPVAAAPVVATRLVGGVLVVADDWIEAAVIGDDAVRWLEPQPANPRVVATAAPTRAQRLTVDVDSLIVVLALVEGMGGLLIVVAVATIRIAWV